MHIIAKKIMQLLVLVSACMALVVNADWHKNSFDVMGTRATLELWLSEAQNPERLFEAVEHEMRRIERLMSPYIEESEISAINRGAGLGAQKISAELAGVISRSLYFSQLSNGVFDISFASVGSLYDYRKKIRPDGEAIQNRLPLIDYKSIVLKNDTIELMKTGMRIDLGGIAKGYAIDQSIQLLLNAEVESALVTLGGDSRVIGNRGTIANSAQLIPWMVGIKHPRTANKQALRLPLTDAAFSTSGDYERYFFDGEQRVHHIIHPSSGESATGLMSATIIGPASIDCDALSTTVFILGKEAGLMLINQLPDYDAVLIDAQGKVYYSNGLQTQ